MGRLLVACLLALPLVARADWEVRRSPFDPNLAARYLALLHRNPDDAFAWRRLTAMYRRYRTLAQLARELEGPASRGDLIDLYLLGNLARDRGDLVAAESRYRAVLEARPDDERAEAQLADVALREKKLAEARALLEKVAARRPSREVYRKLADLALAERDTAARARWLDAVATLAPDDLEAQRERAEALAAARRDAEARAAFRELAPRLVALPEKQAAAWSRAADLAAAAGDDAEALELYRRAERLVARGHWLRRELGEKVTAIYRTRDDLRTLIAEEERTAPSARGFAEWERLARLHEEVGATDAAMAAWRRALAASPRALDARRRLIALLDREGRTDEAIAEYRRLIELAPGEPRFQLELAERLARDPAGRERAIALLNRLGARSPRDPSIHAALAEQWMRLGEVDRAQREQELLTRLEPREETHLVDLGELYWQRGDRRRAVETWRRLAAPTGRPASEQARGLARLADVLADHDQTGEAIELYERAIKLAPKELAHRRGLASALERMHRTAEAERTWMEIFEAARDPASRPLRLEAQQRMIALAQREGRLGARLRELRARMVGPPPDDDFAAPLVEAYLKLGRLEDAEQTLASLARRARTAEAKGEAQLGLAQVLRARHRNADAIAALERAAQLLPSRAREIYGQIAELSLSVYRDRDAVAYARRAVEISPTDPQAALRLAEIEERSDDDDGAASAYRRALEIDPRATRAQLALARIDLRHGRAAEAARLYRDAMASATVEEQILDGGRRAIDLHEYLGALPELERAMAPLVYAPSPKPIWRKLLLELYERSVPPLAARARRGDAAAERELSRLGERGLTPLLDALSGGEPSERRRAVALLGELRNPNAAPPLLRLVARALSVGAQRSDAELRIRAALAAARLADRRTLPELVRLLADPEKEIRVAALDGLGRIDDPRAAAAAATALGDTSPDVQASACLALARTGQPLPRVHATLRALIVPGRGRSTMVGAACALALGRSGDPAAVGALADLLRDGDGDPQRAAAWALGATGDVRALEPLLRALFLRGEDVRRAAAQALLQRRDERLRARLGASAEVDEPLEVRRRVASLARAPSPSGAHAPFGSDEVDRFASLASDAIAEALSGPRELQLRTLADLDGDDGLALGPLTDGAALTDRRERAAVEVDGRELRRGISPRDRDRQALDAACAMITRAITPQIARLALAPDRWVAARAARLLAHLAPAAAEAALPSLAPDARVAALDALPPGDDGDADPALLASLASPDPRERRAAASAVDRRGVARAALPQLTRLLDDPDGYVRERATHALAAVGADAVSPLARHVHDELPEVRRAIATALGRTGDRRARPPLEALARDGDPEARAAAADAIARLPSP